MRLSNGVLPVGEPVTIDPYTPAGHLGLSSNPKVLLSQGDMGLAKYYDRPLALEAQVAMAVQYAAKHLSNRQPLVAFTVAWARFEPTVMRVALTEFEGYAWVIDGPLVPSPTTKPTIGVF